MELRFLPYNITLNQFDISSLQTLEVTNVYFT